MESIMEEEDHAAAEKQELLNGCSCRRNKDEDSSTCSCKNKKIILMTRKTPTEKYSPDSPNEAVEEDPISACVGEYGRWQLRLTFLLSLFSFPCTFHIFSPSFTAAQYKNFWCARPDHLSSLSWQQWSNYSHSQDGCNILNVNWSSVSLSAIQNNQFAPEDASKIPCSSWEYDMGSITSTIISEWGLVCDRSYLITISDTTFLAGIGIGGIVTGIISDKFGRKNTLMTSLVSQCVIGISIFFCTQFDVYLVLRFLLGFSCVSIVNAGFVLSVELVGGKWRTIAGICNFFPLPVSYMIVPGISLLLPDWRHLQLALTLPGFLLIFLWWTLPESPRWLLSMGKTDELKNVLEKAASENKRELPTNIDKILMPRNEKKNKHKSGIRDLFRRKMAMITLVALFAWFTSTATYYGLVLNVGTFGADLHLTALLSGIVELPAIALSIPILMKLGRRHPISFTMLLGGSACLASVFVVDPNLLWLKITFLMIGKFASGMVNGVLPMYTAELFPTLLRNLGVGAGQVAAGVALVFLPYIWSLATYSARIPMSLVGALAICGGASILLLPETAKRPLSDTIENEQPVITSKQSKRNGNI